MVCEGMQSKRASALSMLLVLPQCHGSLALAQMTLRHVGSLRGLHTPFDRKCSDIGKIEVPQLHGRAARAPYFHDGSAANLQHVVEFYNKRFDIR